MTEFVVVGPLIMLIAMTTLQVGQMEQARLNLDYAAYEAVRAGAKFNGDPGSMRESWFRAMVPWIAASKTLGPVKWPEDPRAAGKAVRELASKLEAPYFRIEVLSPTRQAFDDFADPMMQKILKTGNARVIPNEDLAALSKAPGRTSGLSIQDANILKLRITYGYKPGVPLGREILLQGIRAFRTGGTGFQAALLAAGRIPVVVESTYPMLSPIRENSLIHPGLPESSDPVEEAPDDGVHEPPVVGPGTGTGGGGGVPTSGGTSSGTGGETPGVPGDLCESA